MEKAIIDLVQQLRDEVIANYKDKRLIASGNFERETVVVDGGDSVQIVAPHYVYQMIQGRRGGSAPPVSVVATVHNNRLAFKVTASYESFILIVGDNLIA